MTYYDPATGEYGALGHSINDADTGVLLPISEGSICDATVSDVKRGERGEAGELRGSYDASTGDYYDSDGDRYYLDENGNRVYY